MNHIQGRLMLFAVLLAGGVLAGGAVAADLEILGANYRDDKPFPRFDRFWYEDCPTPDDPDAGAARYKGRTMFGGNIHIFLRNSGSEPITIEDVLLEDMSLKKCIVFSDQRIKRKFASIYFADLSSAQRDQLIAAGEPVWWKVEPQQIEPGGVGRIVVRLRRKPSTTEVHLFVKSSHGAADITIPTGKAMPRVATVAFSPELDRAYLYVERAPNVADAPFRVEADGRDVTRYAAIAHDPAVSITTVMLRFKPPLESGEMHCFQVSWAEGGTASAAPRVWADEFAYGMWGGPSISDDDVAQARRYVQDLAAHNINLQIAQLGSPEVAAFFKSPEGQRYCQEMGLRKIVDEPGKWGTRDPYAFFIHDEPDAGDFLAKGLEGHRKVGALAQWAVGHMHELRENDPSKPQMLNIDNTYRPENWYTYGQLPDILASDPYYQNRIARAYAKNPCRLRLYLKPTFLYGTATIAHWACAPNPLHIILYAVRPATKDQPFRFPTPQEKRIEAFYALAGGARGLSYWWYTPAKRPVKREKTAADGVGAAAVDPDAARLWREIGLIGAEVRTAGPILTRSCPVDLSADVSNNAIWPRFLLAGSDTLVMLVVNEQYATDRVGTVFNPVDDATVRFDAPAWMDHVDAFEISADGVKDISCKFERPRVTVDLGRLELTRIIVVTQDSELRGRLGDLYEKEFAAKVKKLQAQ